QRGGLRQRLRRAGIALGSCRDVGVTSARAGFQGSLRSVAVPGLPGHACPGYNDLRRACAERRTPVSRVTTPPLPGTTIDPRYPDSDGRFMGETDYHNLAMAQVREDLEDHFAPAPVYVASNLIWYFKKGDATKRRDPDVLVAKNVGK